MCGIAGIIGRGPVSTPLLARMTRRLAHRGPDGEGLLVAGPAAPSDPAVPWLRLPGDTHVGLGHRRLAIVDLSAAGHQPMLFGDRYAITYNGEVYNHLELRVELEQAGYLFHTRTDTEVILAAFDRWGSECLARFNGMFAFALLDVRERRLFLARDRLGVKPLYLATRPGLLLFASEIKALLEHGDCPREPDEDYLRTFLEHGAAEHAERTAFRGIVRLGPGACIDAGIDDLAAGRVAPRKYWSLTANEEVARFEASRADAFVERYRELLADAVRLRLRADVRVGSALSGGLDSSSIVHLVNEQLHAVGASDRQVTFSSVYSRPETRSVDESGFIDQLTEELGVDSLRIEPEADQVRREYGRMIYAMDTPPDGTCMSGWFTFRLVSHSGVTVTLDGQGADEQLAGYYYYYTYWLAEAPAPFREWLAARRTPGTQRFATAGLVLRALRNAGLGPAARRYVRRRGGLHDPMLGLNARLVDDTCSVLVTLLHYADRASMAHAVESRMPFLDYRLVEFLAQVPASYKVHNGWTKYLARLAFASDLPDEIVWRRSKLGWPAPDQYWLGGPLRDWVLQLLSGSRYLAHLGAQQRGLAHAHAVRDVRSLVRHLNVAAWHDVFFEDGRALIEAGSGVPHVLPGRVQRDTDSSACA